MDDYATRSPRVSSVTSNRPGSPPKELRSQILQALSPKERKIVLAKSKFVDLPTGSLLIVQGQPIRFVYFIAGGIGSVLNVLAGGRSVEVGLTSSEGFVGVPLLVGLRTSTVTVVMQIGGAAFKVSARDMKKVLKQCPRLRALLLRYSQELSMQAAQSAACNRAHSVDKRLARWLLMSQDRLGGDEVPLTQQFLAHMLGTRRASVSVAAGVLQRAGVIAHSRGKVRITDRAGLEKMACECYGRLRTYMRKWQAELHKVGA